MPSSVRSKDAIGSRTPIVQAPMSERQQMALLMQMTSINESLPKSPGGTSYPCSRQRDRNERGETPLHLAAIKGDVEQVSRLISNRVDPNTTDFAGWTALHEACNYGWHEVALKLVQAGANVNAKGLDNDTPLHDAAINGHLHIVKLLVEHGADIHSKNSRGKTPLELAPSAIKPHLLNPDLPIPEPAVPSRAQPRNRDEKKITESTKQKQSVVEENMDANKTEDVYEFKSKEQSPDQKNPTTDNDTPADTLNTIVTPSEDNSKRHFSEVSESTDDGVNEDDNRKKKRKDESIKEKPTPRNSLQNKAQCSKQASGGQNKNANSNVNKLSTSDKKSPCPSPKVSTSDPEDDSKSDLKVPPLKIVIPQTTSSEQETGVNRNSKSNSQRTHQALPYVVPSSNSSDSNDKDITVPSTPEDSNTKTDEKKDSTVANPPDEQRVAGSNQRVLRSSYRAGTSHCPDRSSNNSSPQLQRSHSPSPSTSPAACTNTTEVPVTSTNSSNTISKTTDSQANVETENSTASTSGSNTVTCTTAPVELHPRKRKMKPSKEGTVPPAEPPDVPADPQVHPHDQPITNCYQLFLDIRKQIEKRRKGLFPVQPKPPQGFKDYLMNRCTYVLAGTTSTSPNISYPPTLHTQMKDLFADQEKERYRLRMQHVIEKEKLVLSVEQEILRVHGRAARALANQSLPFSVCSILRDEEVYNLITPEQEEKDRNARSRYNGRLFLSWLQDVDDKWEKIKEHMLLRHHNEAESLHAVQKMDWEWKMKELSLCDRKTTPSIDELHVPMVHVSDDFDLLPA